jgi:uncharacterized protein YjbI with pentapeptide repeats
MANPVHLEKLNEGVEAWNRQQATYPLGADFTEADLAEKDLSEANLRSANFKDANLQNAKLGRGTLLRDAILDGANLSYADLSGADLQNARFIGADLRNASLRETNLQGADLSDAFGGLRTEQLAGADLTGAKLPEQLKKLYDGLENVKGISESARKIFLGILAGCLYCWLTIATTTDVNLITNRASSPLPIIQTQIPIVGFYVVAPLLVLCVYFYFHFYLQKLWEELGSLPAIFPDGRPLHTKVDPWLLNDLVRSYLPKLNTSWPLLSYVQLWISVLLAWWVVPITMLFFWGRYLRRHDSIGTVFHVVLLVISLVGAVCFLHLAIATLRGAERKPFTRKELLTGRRGMAGALALLFGAWFGLLSWGAIWGVPSKQWTFGAGPWIPGVSVTEVKGPSTWVPRFMELFGYSPFASLAGVDVSQKKPNWSQKDDELGNVVGAQLNGANLRYALARRAFFAFADLSNADLKGAFLILADMKGARLLGCDLTGATLDRADLTGAKLIFANLNGADLKGAHLSGADLTRADLAGADLSDADLTDANLSDANLSGVEFLFVDLHGSKNLSPRDAKRALHWDQAFYDDETLKALGLSRDHNEILAEQQKERQKMLEKAPWQE